MSSIGVGGTSGGVGVDNVSLGIMLPRGLVYPSNISDISAGGVCGVSV